MMAKATRIVASTMIGDSAFGRTSKPDDPAPALAAGLRGEHVVTSPDRQDGTARDPRHARCEGDGDRDHRVARSASEHGHDEQREEQIRNGEETVEYAHDDGIDPSASDARDDTDQGAETDAKGRCPEAEGDGGRGPVQEPRQDVPAELVRPEGMRPAWTLEPHGGAECLWVVRGERGPEQRHDEDDEKKHRPCQTRWASQDVTHSAPGGPAGR
jgi:hypothetical protein